MEDETLEALKASIRKWRRNAIAGNPGVVRMGVDDCPLCSIFNTDGMKTDDVCKGCPVFLKTGLIECKNSPYDQVREWRFLWISDESCGENFRNAARAEVAFLESLLPDGEKA